MDEKDIQRVEQEIAERKVKYQAIQNTPGMVDLLAWLDDEADKANRTAKVEMDNAVRKSLYLQSACIYENVEAHLASMFSKGEQDRK